MTPEDIREAVETADIIDAQDIEIADSRVLFCVGFYVDEEEEVHDAAFSCLCNLQSNLELIRLHIVNSDSDNDSIWGEIEQLPSLLPPQ